MVGLAVSWLPAALHVKYENDSSVIRHLFTV